MLAYRSTVAAVTLAGAVLGCADPEQPTDLRTDGPPNVTAVMVMSDLETALDPPAQRTGILTRLIETATFCRPGDEKRPGLVGLPDFRVIQVCPEALSQPAPDEHKAEAAPPTWFVRIVFDKLLDADIEELVPQLDANGNPTGGTIGTLRNTQPVTFTCNGTDVPYDGYYVPNGNRISWPLGPALFIQPLSSTSVPTDASCTVSIKDIVHNKAGESVPADQRSHDFKLAPMRLRFSNPDQSEGVDGSLVLGLQTSLEFFWTAALKPGADITTDTPDGPVTITQTTLDPALVKISSGPNLNGEADPAVCNGTGGAPVPSASIRTFLRGSPSPTTATTSQLVMRLDVGGPTAVPGTRWAPDTTYLVTFDASATIEAAQGGPAGTFPADYKFCFHTPAP